jgi:hypothetical protein
MSFVSSIVEVAHKNSRQYQFERIRQRRFVKSAKTLGKFRSAGLQRVSAQLEVSKPAA